MRTKININDLVFLVHAVYDSFISDEASKIMEERFKRGESLNEIFRSNLLPFLSPKVPFKYQHLLDQATTYELSGTSWDLNIKGQDIDDFLVDVYIVMQRMIYILETLDNSYIDEDEESFPGLIDESERLTRKELIDLKKIWDDIMINYEFTGVQIRGIQKNYLNDLLKEFSDNEEFEKCIIIRDRLKNWM
jgi:hypothetical protein